MDFTQQFKNWRNGMYRKTVEELQKDQREKLVIDIRSEQDYIKETYTRRKHSFLGRIYGAHWGDPEGTAGVSAFAIPGKEAMKLRKICQNKGMRFTALREDIVPICARNWPIL